MGLLTLLLEIACVDLHQTEFLGKCSDHLQLIKFWPSCAPGKGVCGEANFFGSALLQPARSVCVSPSAFFIVTVIGCEISDVIDMSSADRCDQPQLPAHGSAARVDINVRPYRPKRLRQ